MTPQPGSGLTSARKYGAAYPYPQEKCPFIDKASLTKKSLDGLPYSKKFSEFKKNYKFHLQISFQGLFVVNFLKTMYNTKYIR